MSHIAPELDELFARARLIQPDDEDVRTVLRRTAFRQRHASARRISSAGAVVLSILAVFTVGAVGAVATGWTPMGLGGSSPVELVTTSDPVPRELTDHLAALRSPSAAQDRDENAQNAAEAVPNSGPVYVDGIRYVGESPLGERMYLVPIHDNVDAGRDPHGASTDSYSAVALVVQGRFGGIGTSNGVPLSSVLSPRGLQSIENPVVGPEAEALRDDASIPTSLKHGSWFSEIVPDGVAAVRVAFPDGASEDFPVHNNVILGHSDHELGGTTVSWLDSAGTVLQQSR